MWAPTLSGMENQLGMINQDIEKLLQGLGQEGLLDDQFAQLMQLQVLAVYSCFQQRLLC